MRKAVNSGRDVPRCGAGLRAEFGPETLRRRRTDMRDIVESGLFDITVNSNSAAPATVTLEIA